jgi:hypothetical protein
MTAKGTVPIPITVGRISSKTIKIIMPDVVAVEGKGKVAASAGGMAAGVARAEVEVVRVVGAVKNK